MDGLIGRNFICLIVKNMMIDHRSTDETHDCMSFPVDESMIIF